jgi:hypothetical protein
VRLEGVCKLKKKSNDLIGNRTCYFPACSIGPQPTTLPSQTIDSSGGTVGNRKETTSKFQLPEEGLSRKIINEFKHLDKKRT